MADDSHAGDESKGHSANALSFTEAVLRLQHDVHATQPDESLAPLVSAVHALRKAERLPGLAEGGLAVWKQLASMDLTARGFATSTAFPPPYASDTVTRLVGQYLHVVRCNSPSSTCNIVLHGVRGVGKSTLLRVLCVLQALYHPQDIVVFWDYEGHRLVDGELPPSPHELVNLVTRWADGDRSTPLIPRACPRGVPRGPAGRLLGLFLDEINLLYSPSDDGAPYEGAQLKWGQQCVWSLGVLGKNTRAVAVCTASASRLPAMAYGKDEWRSYRSLNDTVYKLLKVLPLRSADLVKGFVLSRYDVTIEDEEAARLFRATGGVTRRIHRWATHGRDTEAAYEAALAEAHAALANTAQSAVQAAFTAFASMWYGRGGMGSGPREASKREEGPHLLFLREQDRFLDFDALALLRNSLVIPIEYNYELLVPAMGDAIVSYFEHDAAARELVAFNTIMGDWDWDGSHAAVCAEPILKGVIPDNSTWYPLTLDGGTLYLGDKPAASHDLEQMSGAVLRASTSADAFVLRLPPGDAGFVGVEAFHVNLGKQCKHACFTPGNLQNQRSYTHTCRRDMTTFAGVIAHLEVTWTSFKAQLQAAFEGTEFRLTKACLVSNMPRTTHPAYDFTEAHAHLSVDGAAVPLQEVLGARFWAVLPERYAAAWSN